MSSSGIQNKRAFYNFAKVLSFNAMYNHCVGGRGIGKTYGAQKKVTKDALNSIVWTDNVTVTTKRGIEYENVTQSGECFDQFIYVRRYKEELALSKGTFFAAYQHEFPDWDFRANGWEAQTSPRKYAGMTKGRPWVVIGYFIPLSIAQSFKSVAFPKVKWIIYDEYILEKGATHYLPNEADVFNNFYSTISRYRENVRVLFLANAVTITNPYFIKYKVSPDDIDADGFVRIDTPHIKGFMVVHFIDSEEFESEVYKTKFGKFIQGTEYADYAVGNQFNDNHKSMISSKGSKAYYMYTIEGKPGIFSVWFDPKADKYFCLERRIKDERILVVEATLMRENKTFMKITDKAFAVLRSAFSRDRVRFDTPVSRNAFMEIFDK